MCKVLSGLLGDAQLGSVGHVVRSLVLLDSTGVLQSGVADLFSFLPATWPGGSDSLSVKGVGVVHNN